MTSPLLSLYPLPAEQMQKNDAIFKIEVFIKTKKPNLELTINKVDLLGNTIFVLSEVKKVASHSLSAAHLGVISASVNVFTPQELSKKSLEIKHYVMNHFWTWESKSIIKVASAQEYELALGSLRKFFV